MTSVTRVILTVVIVSVSVHYIDAQGGERVGKNTTVNSTAVILWCEKPACTGLSLTDPEPSSSGRKWDSNQEYRILAATCVGVILARMTNNSTSSISPVLFAVLCTVSGCLNGVCLEPPTVPVPTCQCDEGFEKTYQDLNVCVDRDECRLGFGTICGPGRCVNTPGLFMCECTPPFVPAYNATWCAPAPRPPQNKRNPYQVLLRYGAVNILVNK